jgi:hypothetical protein
MRAPVRPLVPPNARETCREARCEACVRLSLACSLLPDDHESIQGFVARDLKALKGKDRPCHQLLFSDGAQVPLYVDRHEKATPDQAHIFLRSPEVYLVPETDGA